MALAFSVVLEASSGGIPTYFRILMEPGTLHSDAVPLCCPDDGNSFERVLC